MNDAMQSPLDPRLAALFRDYADNHRNPVNVRIHKVAIPLIVFHIIAMLDWIRLFPLPGTGARVTAAHVGYAFAIAWYLRLDRTLGLCMAALFALCFPIGWMMPRPLVVAIAIGAWGLQLAGHTVWEKRQPAFLHNLVHALVGPLYFVATALGRWPAERRRAA
jgi:uncharacterized membrane protein YGL010W